MTKNKLSPTEQINKNTSNLDTLPLNKMVEVMYKESITAATCVNKAAPAIAKAVKEVEAAYKRGSKIFFAGAGTSGRLGVLEAVECPPTFSVPFDLFNPLIAGGKSAIFKAVEGAEDSRELGAKDFLSEAKKGDILIGIAASGNTPYVQGALEAAKKAGHRTILVACNQNADTKNVNVFIYLPTGAEVISGSTRLKAGTATKIALNMITTLAMVRCGKVYKNYMVDVKATNNKLKARAIRLIGLASGISEEKAKALALETDYNVKASVVMAKLSVSKTQALALLKKHKGYLSKIIDDK